MLGPNIVPIERHDSRLSTCYLSGKALLENLKSKATVEQEQKKLFNNNTAIKEYRHIRKGCAQPLQLRCIILLQIQHDTGSGRKVELMLYVDGMEVLNYKAKPSTDKTQGDRQYLKNTTV